MNTIRFLIAVIALGCATGCSHKTEAKNPDTATCPAATATVKK